MRKPQKRCGAEPIPAVSTLLRLLGYLNWMIHFSGKKQVQKK